MSLEQNEHLYLFIVCAEIPMKISKQTWMQNTRMCMLTLIEQNCRQQVQGRSQTANGLHSHITTRLCTAAHIDRFDCGQWGHVIMAVRLEWLSSLAEDDKQKGFGSFHLVSLFYTFCIQSHLRRNMSFPLTLIFSCVSLLPSVSLWLGFCFLLLLLSTTLHYCCFSAFFLRLFTLQSLICSHSM